MPLQCLSFQECELKPFQKHFKGCKMLQVANRKVVLPWQMLKFASVIATSAGL